MVERKHDLYKVQSETPGPVAGPQRELDHVGRVEDSEDEAMEEALAVAMDRLLVTTVEL